MSVRYGNTTKSSNRRKDLPKKNPKYPVCGKDCGRFNSGASSSRIRRNPLTETADEKNTVGKF